MKTSIVLCTYNGSKYISELILSLKNQNIGYDELIICDDNSSDNTISIINEMLREEISRNIVKIYRNPFALGAYDNFKKACSLATGDIIFFCDQDDIWIQDKISYMKNVLELHDSVNVLASNLRPLYEGKTGIKNRIALERQINNEKLEIVHCKAENLATRRSGCTMCVRKEYYEKVKTLWVSNWAHDDFFWKLSVNDNSLAIINHLSVLRRVHNSNASINVKRDRFNRITSIEAEIEHAKIANRNANTVESDIATNKYISFLEERIQKLRKPNILKFINFILKDHRLYRSKSQMLMDFYLTVNKRI